MVWDYRVVRSLQGYAIHEVYYDDDENIRLWSEGGIAPGGDTLEELTGDLYAMMVALERPVLVLEHEDAVLTEEN
ncbi:MAG: hypothetical protein WC977_03750 [Anaerovoracaceae bacterium]